ncbi:MAG: hypothetical protein V4662_01550 [Verrucomicrobiota bacterium]
MKTFPSITEARLMQMFGTAVLPLDLRAELGQTTLRVKDVVCPTTTQQRWMNAPV